MSVKAAGVDWSTLNHKIMLGGQQICKIYAGNTLIYPTKEIPSPGPGPEPEPEYEISESIGEKSDTWIDWTEVSILFNTTCSYTDHSNTNPSETVMNKQWKIIYYVPGIIGHKLSSVDRVVTPQDRYNLEEFVEPGDYDNASWLRSTTNNVFHGSVYKPFFIAKRYSYKGKEKKEDINYLFGPNSPLLYYFGGLDTKDGWICIVQEEYDGLHKQNANTTTYSGRRIGMFMDNIFMFGGYEISKRQYLNPLDAFSHLTQGASYLLYNELIKKYPEEYNAIGIDPENTDGRTTIRTIFHELFVNNYPTSNLYTPGRYIYTEVYPRYIGLTNFAYITYEELSHYDIEAVRNQKYLVNNEVFNGVFTSYDKNRLTREEIYEVTSVNDKYIRIYF